MMNQTMSETLASQVIDGLRKTHSGEKYRCVRCYHDEPCPERQLVRQWDLLRSEHARAESDGSPDAPERDGGIPGESTGSPGGS